MSTNEQVWQGHGLAEQLAEAEELELNGEVIAAACLRASAYYSHFSPQLPWNPVRAFREFAKAKQYAISAADEIGKRFPENLTYGQCDVIGTILLRRWLWIKPNVSVAMRILDIGLSQDNVPPHARALMTIGLAEGYYMINEKQKCFLKVMEALAYENDFGQEYNPVDARRQFSRVLRRAAVLIFKLGDSGKAEKYLGRAYFVAGNSIWGSKSQIKKIELALTLLHLPSFVRWFLPQ